MAEAYVLLPFYTATAPQDAYPKAKSAALKALQLDDKLAEAHSALGLLLSIGDLDMAGSISEFQRAIALNPNYATARHWYGNAPLLALGRFDEAIAEGKRAIELDPFSPIINADLGQNLYNARRYDEAIAQAKRTLLLNPRFGVALFWLEGSLRHKGMFKEAVALRQAVATPEQAKVIAEKFKTDGFASLLREGGEKFKSGGAFIEAARSYAAAGDKEVALSLLEECYQRRCSSMVTVKAEPDFDDLRSDARFQELVNRIGFR